MTVDKVFFASISPSSLSRTKAIKETVFLEYLFLKDDKTTSSSCPAFLLLFNVIFLLRKEDASLSYTSYFTSCFPFHSQLSVTLLCLTSMHACPWYDMEVQVDQVMSSRLTNQPRIPSFEEFPRNPRWVWIFSDFTKMARNRVILKPSLAWLLRRQDFMRVELNCFQRNNSLEGSLFCDDNLLTNKRSTRHTSLLSGLEGDLMMIVFGSRAHLFRKKGKWRRTHREKRYDMNQVSLTWKNRKTRIDFQDKHTSEMVFCFSMLCFLWRQDCKLITGLSTHKKVVASFHHFVSSKTTTWLRLHATYDKKSLLLSIGKQKHNLLTIISLYEFVFTPANGPSSHNSPQRGHIIQ